MILTGKARVAGVMGWPVGHSRSPRLHGFWLERYAIDGAYVPMAVAPEKLAQALRALPALGFAGCNLTVPHKEAALGLVDRVDDAARRIGAVNTVVVDGSGQLNGSNTDGFGFRESLIAGAPGWRSEWPALVLGAGGAARAVVVALLDAGVPLVRVANRNPARARALAETFGEAIEPVAWDQRAAACGGVGLVVNTTTLGMTGQPPLEIDLAALASDAVVSDIVYTPLITPLLAAARARGNCMVDGLGMLLHQARPGFAAWFGREPVVDDALRRHVALDLL
jgi:shikimate dehydrogenase